MAPIKTPSSRLLAMFLQEHAQPGFHPFLMEKGMPHNKQQIRDSKLQDENHSKIKCLGPHPLLGLAQKLSLSCILSLTKRALIFSILRHHHNSSLKDYQNPAHVLSPAISFHILYQSSTFFYSKFKKGVTHDQTWPTTLPHC